MSGSANGQVLDHYLHTQYEVIRIVHDNLDTIRAVASHLTPVEDLVDFREEVEALYAKLGVLTTASELILSATPSGIAMLTAANAAAQRQLLQLKSAAMREEEYFATATGLAAAELAIAELNTLMDGVLSDLATKASAAELAALSAEVDLRFAGTDTDLATLETQVNAILADLASGAFTAQLRVDVDAHEARLDQVEGQITGLVAQNVDVDSRLTSVTDLVTGHGSAINGLYTEVQADRDGAAITVGRVTELETELVNVKTGQAANTTAVQNLTSHTSMLDGEITTQGELLTALTSRIDGAEGDNDATALAVQNLTTTVSQQGALLSTASEATTQLASRIDDTETGIANNASALGSLTTEVTQLGDTITIASEDIVALKAEMTSPGNLAPNAGFEGDTHGWTIFNRGAGWTTAQLGRNESAETMLPLAMNALSVAIATQPTGKLGIKSDNLPTRGGQRYILSGYLAGLNCVATLEWRLLDQAGQIIQFGSIGESRIGGTTDINEWPRLSGEIPANNDARELQIQVWIQTVEAAGPKLWLLRPMLEEVSGLQDGPSPWVPGITGLARNTAEAVTTLTARIDGVEGDLTATASEVTELGAGIGTLESALVNEIITSANKNATTAATVNQLSSRLDDVEADANGAVTAVSGLNTRMSNVEGTVEGHTSSLTTLQAQVDSMDQDTGGQGAAIANLDVRVTATEDGIETHSQQITALQNSVTSANKIFAQDSAPATAGRTTGDLWIDTNDGNKIYTFNSATGTWVLRADGNKNKIFVQTTAPTATGVNDLWFDSDDNYRMYRWTGSAWQEVTDPRTTANASAITTLNSKVATAEGNIASHSNAITTLENSINSPTTGLSATSTAVNQLTSRVQSVEGVNTAQADSLQSLSTTVGGHTSTISTHASSINGLKAEWNLSLNVNGHVTGIRSVNNGTYGEIVFVADSFKLISPGHNPRTLFSIGSNGGTEFANDMYLGNGRIIIDTGTHMLVQGIGFGVNNEFVQWYGPKMSITSCSRALADMYLTRTGSGYFGGSLSAGILKNSVQSTQIGPTATIETGAFGTNGGPKTVICSFSYYNSGPMPGNQKTTWNNKAQGGTVVLERSYNGGAWTQIGTFQITGTSTAEYDLELNQTNVIVPASGSVTVTDNTAGMLNFNYRARITAYSGNWPATLGISPNFSQGIQRLTVVSTEE